MTEITLQKYLTKHTQQEAADAMGCTQGAVWQMLRAQREIYFTLNRKGEVASFREVKKVGRRPGPKPGAKYASP